MKKREERTSIIERFFTSVIFTFSVSVTISIIPFIIGIKGGGNSGVLDLYLFYTSGMFLTIIPVCMIFGFFYHPEKVYKLLGHLWYTEKPHSNISILLWLIIILVGVISYYQS